MYETILQLLVEVVGVASGTLPYAALEVIATIAVLFIIAIPFIIVWRIIRMFLR